MANLRYYPEGFIGTEQAAVLLAKLVHEERWRENFLDGEQDLWGSLGFQLNAQCIQGFVDDVGRHARRNDPCVNTLPSFERLCDFDEALQILQKVLHAGRFHAQFCDQNGHFDFIGKEGWGGDGGVDALLTGVVSLDDGFRRLVLLPQAEIEKLAQSIKNSMKRTSGKGTSAELPKNAPRPNWENAFNQFRQQAAAKGRIPTYDEDVAFLKPLGVGRNQARKIRERYPRLARGEHRRRTDPVVETADQSGAKPGEKKAT